MGVETEEPAAYFGRMMSLADDDIDGRGMPGNSFFLLFGQMHIGYWIWDIGHPAKELYAGTRATQG